MGRFGENPLAFFDRIYDNVAPWEIGGVQPAMAQLLKELPPNGTVLDLGSGTGDLAIHLACSGHRVLGIEFVESAVIQARKKASLLAPEAASLLTFEIADATRPSALGSDFGAIVDSGFLHLLDLDETDRFVEDLGRALRSGGRCYLHEFAIEFPIDHVPRAITHQEIHARFNMKSGWRVLDVRDAEFLNRVAPPVAAIAACIEKL